MANVNGTSGTAPKTYADAQNIENAWTAAHRGAKAYSVDSYQTLLKDKADPQTGEKSQADVNAYVTDLSSEYSQLNGSNAADIQAALSAALQGAGVTGDQLTNALTTPLNDNEPLQQPPQGTPPPKT